MVGVIQLEDFKADEQKDHKLKKNAGSGGTSYRGFADQRDIKFSFQQ